MSMDEMLLNELYGSEEVREDEEVKQAQVELVEAVAAEAGVNLNELDDDELSKFAHYVLTDEDEQPVNETTGDPETIEKLAEADLMGRQMARSYVEELHSLSSGDTMINDAQAKVASAMNDVSDAWAAESMQKTASYSDRMVHELIKLADPTDTSGGDTGGSGSGDATPDAEAKPDAKKKWQKVKDFVSGADVESGTKGSWKRAIGAGKDQKLLSRVGRGGATAALAAGGLYGGYKGIKGLMGGDKPDTQEKKASLLIANGYEALALAECYSPEEFAKEAEFRAAEILAANGIHPQTFQDIQPETVKLASFPGVEYAVDNHEAKALTEYNDMLDNAALHLIQGLVED